MSLEDHIVKHVNANVEDLVVLRDREAVKDQTSQHHDRYEECHADNLLDKDREPDLAKSGLHDLAILKSGIVRVQN